MTSLAPSVNREMDENSQCSLFIVHLSFVIAPEIAHEHWALNRESSGNDQCQMTNEQ
jgi:hypothetical protein